MPIAHAGHYASSGLLFVLGPFLLFALILAVGWVRARRQGKLVPRQPPPRWPTRARKEAATQATRSRPRNEAP